MEEVYNLRVDPEKKNRLGWTEFWHSCPSEQEKGIQVPEETLESIVNDLAEKQGIELLHNKDNPGWNPSKTVAYHSSLYLIGESNVIVNKMKYPGDKHNLETNPKYAIKMFSPLKNGIARTAEKLGLPIILEGRITEY